MKTGVTAIDREISAQTFGLIGFEGGKTCISKLLMTIVKNASLSGNNCLLFLPPNSYVDNIYCTQKPKITGDPGFKAANWIEKTYNYESDLNTFHFQNPLDGSSGSVKRFDSAIGSMKDPHLVMFLFTNMPSDTALFEMRWLQSKYTFAMIAALPGNLFNRNWNVQLPKAIKYAMQFEEVTNQNGSKEGPVRIKPFFAPSNPMPMPPTGHPTYTPDDLELDANDFYVQAKPKPTRMTLAEVDAQLYDLRGFDAQAQNLTLLNELMARRHELTKTTKRPAFMS